MSATWDQSGLDAAIRERLQFPGRTEAQIINTAAYWVAVNAKNEMPFTTVGRIDAELNVAIIPRYSKTGRTLPYTRSKRVYGSLAGTARKKPVPLGVLIVQAQTRRGSNYNNLTNHRYFRAIKPFAKGIPAKLGQAFMRAAINRLVRARHSSTKFLLSGWIAAIKTLRPFAVNKSRAGETPPLDDARSDLNFARRGEAIPARETGWRVQATIANLTGLAGPNATNFNAALMQHGAPALQRAIDREEALMRDYIAKAYADAHARFNARVR